MSNPKIKFKRSSVEGKKPSLSNLELGEVALNTYDGKLFTRQDTSGVGIATTITNLTPWSENFGGNSIFYTNSVGIGTTKPEDASDPNNTSILNVGVVTANFLYGNGSNLVDVNVSSAATIATATITNTIFGSGTAITSVDTNLSSVSTTDNTLASAKAIKTYVDNQITSGDLDIAGDTGTGSVDLNSQSLTIAGTESEIVTSASGQTITVGLPDNVIVGSALTVTGALDVNDGLEVNKNSPTFDRVAQFNSNSTTSLIAFGGSNGTGENAPEIGQNNSALVFNTQNETRAFISADGNFGIGTTSPLESLHIQGDTAKQLLLSNSDLDQNALTGSSFDIGFGATSGNTYTDIRALTNGRSVWGDLILQKGGGNVGIGTTDPGAKLDIVETDVAQTPNASSSLVVRRLAGAAINLLSGNTATSLILFGDTESAQPGRIAYSHSDNSLQFVTSNNERMRIDSDGNVGIGTSSPSQKLDVRGTVLIGERDTSNAVLEIGGGATGNRNAFIDLVGDTTYFDFGLRILRNNAGANAVSSLTHRGTGDFTLATNEAAAITFKTTANERARIDSSGRLLIATSASRNIGAYPSILQLEGSQNYTNSSISLTHNRPDGGGPEFRFAKSRGTSAGSNTLVASGDDLGTIFFYGADGTDAQSQAGRISCEVDGTPGANDMPGRLVFSTTAPGASSPTTRMLIDSDGNVGINETDPSYKLDVDGDIRATGELRGGGSNITGIVTSIVAGNNISISGSTGQVTISSSDATNASFDTLVVSGFSTFTDGSFSGDLSVAGTLTYEDVTNVDSIGLITARSGVNITNGGLTATGDILPNTDNTGNVGTTNFTWNNGQFTNLSVNGTLTVRAAIDLADNDQIRLGSGDDSRLFYDGTNNTLELELESTANSFIITDNGSTKFTFEKDGDLGIGVNPGAKLDVFGTARIGGTNSSGRRADFDTDGRLTLAYGDNSNTSNLILANLATDATTNHGSNIAWDFGTNTSATPITAARIDVVKEQQWTSTASTQDAKFAIVLAENGVLGDKLSISSNGNVTLTGDLDLDDNKKILLGTGNDCEIYHNGTHNIFESTNGNISIQVPAGSEIQLAQGGGSFEQGVKFIAGGAVQLFNNNSLKLATTSTGVDVTGDLILSGELNLMGSSDSNKFLDVRVGTNTFHIRKTTGGDAGHEVMATFTGDAGVGLYYNAVKKFETTSTGVDVTGICTAFVLHGEGGTFNAGNDTATDAGFILEEENTIYTKDGTFLRNLIQKKSDIIIIGQQNTSLIDNIELKPGGAGGKVKLHAGGTSDNVKLSTTSTGVDVTGNITLTGDLDLDDNKKILLGTGNDCEIYHDGSANIIQSTNGSISLQVPEGSEIQLAQGGSFEHGVKFIAGGAVQLYNNNSLKLATTSTGVDVTGLLSATTKSFVIDHPTKEGMKLRYGSLEGPENGVYVRGRLKGNNTIELPDYWTGLVDEETITVNLTPIGRKAPLHSVVDIADNTVVVESANDIVDCYYTVFGERKDVERFEVEF